VTDAEIEFIGREGSQLDSAIRELGSVVTTGISAEQSTMRRPKHETTAMPINLTPSR